MPVAVIDKLAFGGSGICRINGKVCFVPYSCPGDEVSLKVTTLKKSYCNAEILDIISPSPLRTVPVCNIFGSCGGCNWQHISYTAQIEQKLQIFSDTLWRGARVGGELIRNVVAAPVSYGYRGRVQFKVSSGNGELKIGFFRHGSHIVEDAVDGCPVAAPDINEVLKCFRSVLTGFSGLNSISQISIDSSGHGLIAIIHLVGRETPQLRAFLIDRMQDLAPCTGLLIQADKKSIPEKIWGDVKIQYQMPGGYTGSKPILLTYRPGGFAQVNQDQNMALLFIIRRLGNFTKNQKVLDLYCGNGNFSVPLAYEVASVVGIEGSKDSVVSAEYNSAVNELSNSEFICADVCAGLKRLVNGGRLFDIVLLDPPRIGAGDAVSDIVRLKPDKIIYVSCDPNTLARDCRLFGGYGYQIVESVPVDMFPHTYHLESVTLLLKI